MRKTILILLLLITSLLSYGQNCTWQICLGDTYGDGWNGNSIDVTVNGTLIYDDLTLDQNGPTNGDGPECHNLTINTGESISVTFNATGTWTDECDFFLYDSNGNPVANGDDSNNISEFGSCESSTTDCNWQICIGDTYGDGWNGGSIDVVVDGVVIYDDLFLDDGTGVNCYYIPVNFGENIQITDVVLGSYPDEAYFYFYDGNGDRIVYTFIDNAPVSYAVNTTDCATERINGDCGSHNITVCGTENIQSNSVGGGNYNELNSSNDGCLGGENFTTWIYFHAETAGDIGFSITPDGGATDDYDFAVWETTNCPPTTNPIRCSWAVAGDQDSYCSNNRDIGYVTGIGSCPLGSDCDAVDTSEDQCGDGWVDYITATTGQEFTMVIDNYSSTTNSFTLTWDLQNGASLDCTNLPVDFITSKYDCYQQIFSWSTSTETNNDYFTIKTGSNFNQSELVVENEYIINGSGNNNQITNYNFDLNINNSYIQLYQTDFDGTTVLLNTNYISCEENKNIVSVSPNPVNKNTYSTINGDYKTIQLYDMIGKEVYAKIIDNKITGLSSGIYIIIIDNQYKIKLIVN